MKRANPSLIGAFVLGAFALLALAVLLLGGGSLFTYKQRAVIYFDGSVNGLSVGSPVSFRGVRVGTVDRIQIRLDKDSLVAKIPVFISIEPGQIEVLGGGGLADLAFRSFIDRGLCAKLAMQSFVTGQLGIDLDMLPEGVHRPPASTQGIPEIPAVKSDFDVLRDQLTQVHISQLVEEMRSTLQAMHTLAQTANDTLAGVRGDLQATAASAHRATDHLDATIGRLQTESTRTLDAFTRLSENLDRQVDTLSPQLQGTLAAAQAAMKNANASLANLSDMTAPGAQVRSDLESSTRDLAAAADSLRSFAETVERNPQVLLTGRHKP
ncbi:MAG: MCE family protein [Nevskia sp.]|nr:MCE family protein [Nevskia sp.]